MTSKTETVAVREMLAGIHDAFYGAQACHCHTVPKLGHDELINALLAQGVIPPSQGFAGRPPAIEASRGVFSYNVIWALQRAGVRFLDELTEWTYADLLRLDRVSRRMVEEVQRGLARFGLTLKDSHPAILDHPSPEPERAPREPSRRPAETPAEIRANAFGALFKLGSTVMRDGASLVRVAGRVGAGEPQAGRLREYITKGNQACVEQVAAIVAPLIDLEDAERAAAKARAKAARRQPPAPAQPDPENVVRPAFAALA